MTRIATIFLILITIGVSSFSQDNDNIIRMKAIKDFPILSREGYASNRKPYAPFHVEEDLEALAGDDLNFTFHMAAAEGVFQGKPGKYIVNLNTLTERDGECVYNVYVNDIRAGLFQQNPPTNEFIAPATLQWIGVEIPANARIRVESNNWSNLKRHEDNFYEYARGRWTSVDFIPENSSEKYIKENSNLGIFDGISNIKSSEQAFRVNFNKIEQAYYLAVTGRYGKDTSEGEVFLWKQVNGDFVLETLVSQLNFIDNADCMTGLMIRQTQESNTPYVAVVLEENGLVSLQYREDPGSPVKKVLFAVKNAEMIQLERKGQSFILSAAKFGEDYERQSIEISGFTGTHQMGFFVSSNSPENPAMVRFGNVRFFEEISVNSEN